jgi:hypothetical protein
MIATHLSYLHHWPDAKWPLRRSHGLKCHLGFPTQAEGYIVITLPLAELGDESRPQDTRSQPGLRKTRIGAAFWRLRNHLVTASGPAGLGGARFRPQASEGLSLRNPDMYVILVDSLRAPRREQADEASFRYESSSLQSFAAGHTVRAGSACACVRRLHIQICHANSDRDAS